MAVGIGRNNDGKKDDEQVDTTQLQSIVILEHPQRIVPHEGRLPHFKNRMGDKNREPNRQTVKKRVFLNGEMMNFSISASIASRL